MWVIKFANKEISVTLPLQNLANFGKFREILYQQKKINNFKGCVRYIFANLFFKSKQEHLSN